MAQQIINTGANANDGTGEPLRQAFTAVNENFTEIYTAGPVGTDVRIVGNTITTLQINQNLTLKPNGIGLIQANATVVPSVNLVYDLGSPTKQWDSVYAGYFVGNGALLTGIAGGNAGNSFSTIAANGVNIVANSSTGVLTLTPGNNVTIIGSAGSDTVTFGISSSPSFSGNVTGGNFLTSGRISTAGNITGTNLRATGAISTAGNITANNVVFLGNLFGNISTAGNVIAGNVISTQAIVAASGITSAGNISGNYFFGNGVFLTGVIASAGPEILYGCSSVRINGANANATISINSISNVAVFSTGGMSTIGNITANIDVLANGQISALGNVTGNYIFGNGALLTGIITSVANINNGTSNITVLSSGSNITVGVNGTGNVAVFANTGAYVNGVVSASGNVTANYFIGNGSQLTGVTAAGVNAAALTGTTLSSNVLYSSLTQVGNLANLSVVGNTVGGNFITTGIVSAAGNVTANYFIGNGSQLTGIDSTTIQNGNSNVKVYANGNVSTSISGISNVVVVSSTGQYVSGVISATGNILGNNVNTGVLSATGNVVAGNLNAAGLSLSSNVVSDLNVTSNIAGGNISTPGLLSTADFSISGKVTGNLIPSANISYNLGNATNAFKDLYLSGNSIYIGDQTISSNATGITVGSGNVAGNNINAANAITAGVISASGNATAGNVLTGGLISATGNITGGNLSAVNLVINNIASDDSSYVTVDDGLTVIGEILAAGNITGSNVNTNNIVGSGLTITSTGALNLVPTGNITVNARNINNLADPVQDQDAATKSYVDVVAQGLDPKASVVYATSTTLPVYTYNNGTAGVGATITGVTTGLLTIDGTAPAAGDRVLVKNEISTNAPYNGIYTVTTNSAGSAYVLTRATDFNQASEIPSAFTFVEYGTINADTGWVCTTNSPVVIGTTNIVFVQFSGAGSYTANTAAGLSLIGSQFNAKVDDNTTAFDGSGNIIVKAGANLTTPNIGVATGTSLSVSGNVRVGNIVIPSSGNINVGNVNIANLATPAAPSDAATKAYVDSQAGNVSGNVIGNLIALGTPADGSLTTNVAYPGWTTATFVTDGLDDLNQVALNIAKNTFVGQASLSGTPLSGSSPITVAFTGSYIGNVNSHLWNFGDGTTSTSANPSKTYSNVSGGQFTVSYTAYNSNGTFNGNAANGAKGSVSSFTATNYITLYTPTPISAFTLANSSIDTGSSAQISNASQYANYFELNWGDGTANVNFNNGWTTQSHTYTNSANTDSRYGIVLKATSNTAGPANVSTVSSTSYVKVYSPQSPAFTANTLSVINYAATSGGVVSFRNDTPGSPGTTAVYGAQQLYNWQWGDGTANSNINIQSGLAGNPGAANITHTFALSPAQQTAGTTVNYTANLWLYTGYSTSPFRASNVTITVEPEVRANFLGTANTQSDASGATAQTGYIYTDYNGNNRAVFSFQNTSQLANLYNWSFGDSTFANGIANLSNVNHTYTATGSYTVALTANGTPGTTAQSNTQTRISYINIAANPAAPGALSTKTISMSTASEGTSPLLAAGATDNSGGNIPAAGSSVTRYISATPIVSTTASGANTSTTGTLTAYVNNTAAGNTPFTVGTSNTGTFTNLVVSQDADAHTVISATYPTGFYKVFSASVSRALSGLSTGYSDYKLAHSTTGNTNATGFVKDNLSAVPTLSNASVTMTETTAGTYRYISGVPYYNAGSPVISVNSLAVSNLTGQTYRSTTTPVTVLSGTNYESTSGAVISTQTKTYAQIDGPSSMLTGGIPNANVGIASSYTLGNLAISVNGSAQAVATLNTNIINVNGTSTTIPLPTKIQVYSTALTGFDESNIAVAAGLGSVYTDNATRISGLGSGNTPAFSNSTNFYTANAWSGAVTMTGTSEAVVRWGTLQHFNSANFSTGYLPVGPDLITGRSGIQYFTFAFRRATMASFDIILTTTTGIAGLWVAAPGTTIDKSGFSSPTPGYPGPTSTLNGWLTGFQQYNGAGVPGASATGGNPAGTNGCALTGADVIPLNTAISNQRYTMTLGSQNSSNSTGNNILIRIGLSSGQTLTSVAIGLAT
jgi:PKD domain